MEFYHTTLYYAILFIAYLLGSVPWGLVLTRLFTDIDILREGSGNVGATNVRRLAGNRLGVLTLLGDLLKGAFPVYCVALMGGSMEGSLVAAQAPVALVAFGGHLFPAYTRLRNGGKGVATAAGGLLALSPVAFGVTLAVFCLAVWHSRRISVGSLAAAGIMPIAVWVTTRSGWVAIITLVMAILIFIRHKDNIRRIRAGTEPRI